MAGDRGSTPRKLLDATAKTVVESGWGSVTTRGVAERAGVKQGLVHYHFDSIEDLKRAAVVAALEVELERAVEPLDEASPAQILQASANMITSMSGEDFLSRLVIEALPAAARDAAMQRDLGVVLTRFRDLIAARIREVHPSPAAAPEALAALFAACLDGLAFHKLAIPDLDVEAAMAPLYQLLGPAEQEGTRP